MVLTDKDITDFIKSWQADFGETLTPERARTEILRLLNFFASMRKLLPPDGTPRLDPHDAGPQT